MDDLIFLREHNYTLTEDNLINEDIIGILPVSEIKNLSLSEKKKIIAQLLKYYDKEQFKLLIQKIQKRDEKKK